MARSHCPFGNIGTDSLRESGIEWLNGRTKQPYGRGGQVVEPAVEAALEAAFIEQGWGGEL